VDLLIDADADSSDERCSVAHEAALARSRPAVMDARHRVRAITRQSVEAMRLAMAARWKRLLQTAAFIISTMLAVAAFAFPSQREPTCSMREVVDMVGPRLD
jgi:hypothetical protein